MCKIGNACNKVVWAEMEKDLERFKVFDLFIRSGLTSVVLVWGWSLKQVRNQEVSRRNNENDIKKNVGKAGPLRYISLLICIRKTKYSKGFLFSCIFLLQPLPTCPDVLVVSSRLPPRPSSSNIADLPKCACLFTGLMWCPVTDPGLIARHVPLRVPNATSPSSFPPLPLCTHH